MVVYKEQIMDISVRKTSERRKEKYEILVLVQSKEIL